MRHVDRYGSVFVEAIITYVEIIDTHTGTKHPLVFASLLLCDVSENAYCLYSLCRAVKKMRTNVVPVSSVLEKDDEPRRRLVKRSSSVYVVFSKVNITITLK